MADPFRIVGVEHVSVTAPAELEKDVVSWYGDCLQLERVEKPPGSRPDGAWFRAGNHEIHVTIDEHNPPQVAHFAIVVEGIESLVERLRHAGCHIEQAHPIPGRRRFYTRDPAGNRIECVSYDEPRALVGVEERADEGTAYVVAEEKRP